MLTMFSHNLSLRVQESGATSEIALYLEASTQFSAMKQPLYSG